MRLESSAYGSPYADDVTGGEALENEEGYVGGGWQCSRARGGGGENERGGDGEEMDEGILRLEVVFEVHGGEGGWVLRLALALA